MLVLLALVVLALCGYFLAATLQSYGRYDGWLGTAASLVAVLLALVGLVWAVVKRSSVVFGRVVDAGGVPHNRPFEFSIPVANRGSGQATITVTGVRVHPSAQDVEDGAPYLEIGQAVSDIQPVTIAAASAGYLTVLIRPGGCYEASLPVQMAGRVELGAAVQDPGARPRRREAEVALRVLLEEGT